MKKIIGIMSLVVASASFAAAQVELDASLTVINTDEEVTLTIDNHNLDFGNVPMGGISIVVPVRFNLTGTQAKTGTMEIPYQIDLSNGTDIISNGVGVNKSNLIGGTKVSSGKYYICTSDANLGDGVGGASAGMEMTMNYIALGASVTVPGVYTATVPVTAKYN